jgi:PAS domain-containing protein
VIVNHNVTERKSAEEALRRSEADFRSVVEHAPYRIYRASITGRFLPVNPALQKMLGYELEEELLRSRARQIPHFNLRPRRTPIQDCGRSSPS